MMTEILLKYFACKWTKLDHLDFSVVLLNSLVGFMQPALRLPRVVKKKINGISLN